MYKIPILLVFFNRENVVLQTFSRIREAQPAKLYLACDGARDDREGEKQLVDNLREKILAQVDWDCEVKTRFLDSNVGCSLGVDRKSVV